MKSSPKRRLLAMLFLLAMVMIVGGCGDDKGSNSPITDLPVLMPLAIDNTWSYRKITFNYIIHSSSTSNTTFKIDGDTVIGETTWHTANNGEYRNNANGLNINFYSLLGTYGPVIYRYPALVGDGYINPALDGSSTVTVTDIAKPLSLLAGDFVCYGYNSVSGSEGVTWSNQIYFAPGVGRVLTEYYTISEVGDTTMYIREELTAYELH